MMFIIWVIGWLYTIELDDRVYGFWSALGVWFYWPERLAQIHKESKNER